MIKSPLNIKPVLLLTMIAYFRHSSSITAQQKQNEYMKVFVLKLLNYPLFIVLLCSVSCTNDDIDKFIHKKTGDDTLGYFEENGKIFLRTSNAARGIAVTEIKEADAKTFEVLETNGYMRMGKDKNHIYFSEMILEGADPVTFNFIGNYFYKDKNFVYFFGFYNNFNKCQLKGAVPGEFTIYDTYPWGHDSSHVFWSTEPITLPDLNEFQPINENWGKTKSLYIHEVNILDSLDTKSFEIINNNYAKDKNYVYYGTEKVIGCDPKKFIALTDITGHDGLNFYTFARNDGPLNAEQKKHFEKPK